MSDAARHSRIAPMLFSPSAEVAAFVIHAVRNHSQTYRINGAVVPVGVEELVAAMSSGVTQGQAGPTSAAPLRTEQIEVMTPRLVTYETAAELLAISVSTLKRRIAAGDFHPISIGGAARIRVAEIDAFVDGAIESTTYPKGA